MFPYSERPGTSALAIKYKVSDKDKKLRAHRLLQLSDEKTTAFYAAHIGQEAQVLFEKAAHGKAMHGFTENYIRVGFRHHLHRTALTMRLSRSNLATSILTRAHCVPSFCSWSGDYI